MAMKKGIFWALGLTLALNGIAAAQEATPAAPETTSPALEAAPAPPEAAPAPRKQPPRPWEAPRAHQEAPPAPPEEAPATQEVQASSGFFSGWLPNFDFSFAGFLRTESTVSTSSTDNPANQLTNEFNGR